MATGTADPEGRRNSFMVCQGAWLVRRLAPALSSSIKTWVRAGPRCIPRLPVTRDDPLTNGRGPPSSRHPSLREPGPGRARLLPSRRPSRGDPARREARPTESMGAAHGLGAKRSLREPSPKRGGEPPHAPAGAGLRDYPSPFVAHAASGGRLVYRRFQVHGQRARPSAVSRGNSRLSVRPGPWQGPWALPASGSPPHPGRRPAP